MTEPLIKQNSLEAWILAARPKTLAGAAVPVMIGVALAFVDSREYPQGTFSILAATLCFLFAFVMQIDANLINDFFDYAKGTDDIEKRLGPRRACAQGWVSVDMMKRAIALTTCAACLIGLPLIFFGGMEMILIGIICVFFCFLYTTHLSYIGLGDALVIVFFGIIPVCISYYVQLHTCTIEVFMTSIACGLVIDSLLIINNYRDRDNDRDAGKNTIVVRFGERFGLYAYLATGIAACLIGIIFLSESHVLAFVLPFIYLILHFFTYLKIKRIHRGKALNICLGETARNMFIYGICVSVGILLT
ncbi:MAG: 1,4-dihydroxy-2-naphthoate octaprenyltransferase [Prevotella sp.]|nr:1,4-dihydroxy-2-naphthoate octaprenyltransferase [Prevotella sp.]